MKRPPVAERPLSSITPLSGKAIDELVAHPNQHRSDLQVYRRLVAKATAQFGVPGSVVHSFLRDQGAARPSEVTEELAERVLAAMRAEDERLMAAMDSWPTALAWRSP